MTNPWPNCAPLPRYAAAALSAVHLTGRDSSILASLTQREWREALDFADRERLTLTLRDACRQSMPDWVRERLDRNAAANQVRMRGTAAAYCQIAEWLGAERLDFVFLKGLTHAPLFGLPAESRVQYDVDLWLPPGDALRARRLLMARGYESMPGTEELPTDHLPALVRKTGWQWRGDFFDPDIPLPVELHVQFWNGQQERFEAPGVEDFPRRRGAQRIGGQPLPALCAEDAAGYAALHVLRHVLTGSVRLFHVYEIAAMLHARASDAGFWDNWRRAHPPGLRRLEALSFRLAREWFGGNAAPEVEEELARIPPRVRTWFEMFALSPAVPNFRPNKDHLWLHLTLLTSWRDRRQVAAQRILPLRLPVAAGDAFVPKGSLPWRSWLMWRAHWVSHALSRAWHHARALPAVAISAVRWWWRGRRLGE